MAFRMDDRKQRLVVDADGGQGIGFFGWEVADAAGARRARGAAGEGRHQGGARLARARRRAARQGPGRGQRSGRQPARVLPRRRDRVRSVQARPQHLRLPHRPARHGPRGDALRAHRRGDDVLPGGARSSSSATTGCGRSRAISSTSIRATIDRAGRDRQEHGPPHDGGAVLASTTSARATISCSGDQDKIAVTLGRHSGDYVTSFYTWNPSGFMVEYGWGGQMIDDNTWKPFERKYGPSLWGHERALDVAGEARGGARCSASRRPRTACASRCR